MNIETGWYVPTKSAKRPRWVLAVSETHVLYGSGGGGTHRECKRTTFARWVARMKAELKTEQ